MKTPTDTPAVIEKRSDKFEPVSSTDSLLCTIIVGMKNPRATPTCYQKLRVLSCSEKK